ncbi:MAG: DUF4399 domain-containing protein [Gammaproteobacteria bacterium]|jgi:hypothetical protein
MRTITLITGTLLCLGALTVRSQNAPETLPRTEAPAAAEVYIQTPADGAEVRSPFTVRFGLRGMGVAPAGITAPNTGHHHLLIDVDPLPPENLPLPSSDQVRHFGAGQTETELDLPPGEHTLQLVLGDAMHIPHQPPVRSDRITITVVE